MCLYIFGLLSVLILETDAEIVYRILLLQECFTQGNRSLKLYKRLVIKYI